MFLCIVCVQCPWRPGACTKSPGTSVHQAVNCCVSAGDPAWVLKEQLMLLPYDSSLPTDAPERLWISVPGSMWGGPEDPPFSLHLKSYLSDARTQEGTLAKAAAIGHNLSLVLCLFVLLSCLGSLTAVRDQRGHWVPWNLSFTGSVVAENQTWISYKKKCP